MKTLSQHNKEKRDVYEMLRSNAERPNGIACDKCGKELVDTSPGTTLTSSPPQKNVRCPSCGFVGYRIA